jgi:eukaryotic-like serine/threonine-protein kinase
MGLCVMAALDLSHDNTTVSELPTGAQSDWRRSLHLDRIATADPENEGWQHDLALSHGRVAMVEARRADRDSALKAFRKGRDIIARLSSAR